MAISYPLTMPATPKPFSSLMGADLNNQTHFALNRSRQTIRRPGDKIVLDFSLPPMLRAQAAAWQAFGMELLGTYGTFYAGDPDAETIQGTATGTYLVSGGGQVGNVLVIDGTNLNRTDAFKAGDWIAPENKLQMITQDADTDGAGTVSVTIAPGIPAGGAPANGANVDYTAAKGIFRLTSNRFTWNANQISIYGLQFSAEQDL